MTTTVAIIGAGQVGTSIALALNHQLYPAGVSTRMYDVDPTAPDLVKTRFYDLQTPHDNVSFHLSAKAAVENSDIIILATPLSAMKSVVADIRAFIPSHAILTDTGSAKGKAIAEIRDALTGFNTTYIPAHPGNGSQGSGAMTGHPTNILGPNSWMFLIEEPSYKTKLKPAFAKLENFWKMAGVQVATTDAQTHDRFFGTCSHLQHVIAFSLLNSSHKDQSSLDIMKRSGTAFRNLTRVAMSKQEPDQPSALLAMWEPILQQNRKQVLYAANNFLRHFDTLVEIVRDNNPSKICNALGKARAFRSSMKDLEPREGERGEIHDIKQGLSEWSGSSALITGDDDLSSRFQRNVEADFYANLVMPVALAYGQVMNAKDIAPDLALDKANPSFRDGTAPALFSPEYMTQILLQNSDTFLERSANFRAAFCQMTDAIRLGKDNTIKMNILAAQSIRNELPGPRKNKDLREPFLIPDVL